MRREIAWVVLLLLGATATVQAGEPVSEAKVREIVRKEIEKERQKSSLFKPGDEKADNFFDRVDFAVGLTGVLQGSAGAEKETSEEEDVSAATGSMDIELEAKLAENWKGFVLVEAGSGEGLDKHLNLLVGVNDAADDDENVRLSEAWVEGNWKLGGAHSLSARMGKIDLTGEFDTNEVAGDETAQFLGSGFCGNPTFAAPDNDFGAILTYTYDEKISLRFGFADSDDVHDRGGKFADDLFFVGELGVSVEIFGKPGNYRAFVWHEDTKLPELRDDTRLDSPGVGWGLSCDQSLVEGVTAFFRLGMADEEHYEVETWVSGGVELGGDLWGRGDDALGLAYGVAMLGEEAEEAARAGGTDPDDEHHVELYYRLKMNDHMELSPGVQFVGNPGGDADADGVTVFGVRLQVSF